MISERWPLLLEAYRSGQVPARVLHDEAAKDPLFNLWLGRAMAKGGKS